MQDETVPYPQTAPAQPAPERWRELLVTLAWLAVLMIGPYLAAFLLAGLTLGIVAGVQGADGPQIAAILTAQLTPPALGFWISGLFSAVLMILLCQKLAAWRFGTGWQSVIGLQFVPLPARLLGLLVLLLLGYLAWAALVASTLQTLWPSQVIMPEITKTSPGGGGGTAPLAFVFLAVLAPIAEELIFRGYVLARLGTILAPVQAIVLTAALFGCAHFNGGILHPLITLFLGLATGWLRLTRGSLVPGMILHGMVNSLAVAAMLAR